MFLDLKTIYIIQRRKLRFSKGFISYLYLFVYFRWQAMWLLAYGYLLENIHFTKKKKDSRMTQELEELIGLWKLILKMEQITSCTFQPIISQWQLFQLLDMAIYRDRTRLKELLQSLWWSWELLFYLFILVKFSQSFKVKTILKKNYKLKSRLLKSFKINISFPKNCTRI